MGLSQQVGDDGELMKLVESYFHSSDNAVLLAFRVAKSQTSSWTVAGRRTRLTTKPRILSVTAKRSSVTQKFKVKLQVLKQTASDELQTAKVYKLKHLSKVEAVPTDNSGCTFILGFDNLKAQAVAPPQWTMRTLDDRNRLVTCILKLCKENLGRVPKIVGMDIVEMTLWAKANAKSLPIDGPASPVAEGARDGSRGGVDVVERELVSKAEEDDMEALLDSYVLGIDEAEAFSERLKRELTALEAANVHAILESQPLVEEVLHQLDAATVSVEDMDEWLDIFNVKLRHMREDIESIESRNNRLEMQSQNNAALGEELSKLLERLRVPSEYTTLLTAGSFEEASMPENVEACEWLAGALRGLEPPLLDPAYVNVRAVTDKRGELEKLRTTFVRRASDFLRNYFASVVDFMISDKSYFLQKGQLKRPDHADLRYKCRSYARLLQHLKTLDSNALVPLRKHYCSSLNHLLRKEAHEFASELKTQVKGLPKQGGAWLEGSNSSSSLSTADTSVVSEAYSRMLRIFIPLLVDESRFFASFMCFEVVPTGPIGANGAGGGNEDEDDISPLDEDGSDLKPDPNPAELEALNQALQELLVGVEEDFNVVVDWAWKTDPLRCISMHGITEKYLATHKADPASFVRQLLTALQDRISQLFNRFVETVNNQFEKHDKSVKQAGVISYIPRFSLLAQKMESLIHGNSRDIVDSAYKKLVETMFAVLERISQVDLKHADIILLENYAAFQNYMFDLANMVPVLGNYYQQASECYEQACTRYVNTVINHQFERIFQFGQKVENLLYTITPEEVPFQINFSRADLRKLLSSNLKGVEKSLREMYKRMQKHLINSDELLPSLWEKCKEDFLEKYEALEALLVKCYPSETLSPSSEEMKELFKTVG